MIPNYNKLNISGHYRRVTVLGGKVPPKDLFGWPYNENQTSHLILNLTPTAVVWFLYGYLCFTAQQNMWIKVHNKAHVTGEESHGNDYYIETFCTLSRQRNACTIFAVKLTYSTNKAVSITQPHRTTTQTNIIIIIIIIIITVPRNFHSTDLDPKAAIISRRGTC